MTCFETGFSVLLKIDYWKDFSTIITPFIALVSVVYAARQIYISKLEARRATAYSIYNDYLKMCMENETYAYGLTETIRGNDKQYNQYRWFVSRMLFSFEQIIEVCVWDEGWSSTIENQLKRHASHLKESGSVKRNEWSKKLNFIIKNIAF